VIARLSGTLDSVGEDWAVVDVGGVGYLVYCSARTLRGLPPLGHPVALAVETHVREDHIHLYGFAEAAERVWFRRLIGVQGVGARHALAILGALSPDALAGAVIAGDRRAFAAAHGVGAKLAQRLVTELRDKVGEEALAPPPAGAANGDPAGGTVPDAVSALVNLGYRYGDAFAVVADAARRLGPDASLESLVRAGLRELAA